MMSPLVVLVALFSVAFAEDANYPGEAKQIIQCIEENAQSTLNENLEEFMTFLKTIKARNAAKHVFEKLRHETLKLQTAFVENSREAAEQSQNCSYESSKEQNFLTSQTKCHFQIGTKFGLKSGVVLTDFAVNVITILVEDNVDFYGSNLQTALHLVKKLVWKTGQSVKRTVECLKTPPGAQPLEEDLLF